MSFSAIKSIISKNKKVPLKQTNTAAFFIISLPNITQNTRTTVDMLSPFIVATFSMASPVADEER